MSYPQFQAAADYPGALADEDADASLSGVSYEDRNGTTPDGPVELNFMQFPVAGSAITYMYTLANRKISYAQFDEQYVESYKENQTSFENAMKDVEELFGFKLEGDADDRPVLTEYETRRPGDAYDVVFNGVEEDAYTQEQQILYGGYNALRCYAVPPFSGEVLCDREKPISSTEESYVGEASQA